MSIKNCSPAWTEEQNSLRLARPYAITMKAFMKSASSAKALPPLSAMNTNRDILDRLSPQDIFGHLLSYEGSEHAGISVVCDSPCDILFIHYATIGSPCTRSCAHHHQLTQNLLDLISERALNLSRRVEVLSQRTIREKLICYFMQLAAQAKASSFSLPFTMVDLADYLSIDRSAMTRELKRMKEEGLIEMDKRCVRLFL